MSYIDPLLSAIESESTGCRLVIIEDKHLLSPPDNKYAGWRAIQAADEADEDLLFLEDDVRPAFYGAIRDAASYLVPDQVAYSSLHVSGLTTAGVWPSVRFMMSQAVKIPRRSLSWLLRFRSICTGDWEAVRGFDVALASAGHANGWAYEQTERNYFNHVGVISAVRQG